MNRVIHGLIAVAFLGAMPGAVPSALSDCPHHQAHRDQDEPSHDGHGKAAGETAPTPCSCMDDCQSSRPIPVPSGYYDRSSFDHVVEIETNQSTASVLTLDSYRIPYAHGPPEQL
jgi:hypothetical protein